MLGYLYHWLFSYIPEFIIKTLSEFKDKIVNVFNINTFKQIMYERGEKLKKPKTQNKIRNLFILKKKLKEIKHEIIRDVWTP